MKFQKNIKYDIKVVFDAPLLGYDINKVYNKRIKKVVNNAVIKYIESNGDINNQIEDNMKVIITKKSNDVRSFREE